MCVCNTCTIYAYILIYIAYIHAYIPTYMHEALCVGRSKGNSVLQI